MTEGDVAKAIVVALILSLVGIQLYRNFGELAFEEKRVVHETVVDAVAMIAAVFVYNCVWG